MKCRVIEIGKVAPDVAVVSYEQDSLAFEDVPPFRWIIPSAPDIAFGDLKGVLPMDRQHKNAMWSHDSMQLLEPKILVALVKMSEDAVIEHQVEVAVRVGQGRFTFGAYEGSEGKVFLVPGDCELVDITAV